MEGRRHPRFPVTWPVTLQVAQGSLEGNLQNISEGGAFIRCEQRLPERLQGTMTLHIPKETSLAVAFEIVWTMNRVEKGGRLLRGVGVRFLEPSAEVVRTIHFWARKKMGSLDERRERTRCEVNWSATLRQEQLSIPARIKNISPQGAFVHCQRPLSLKETCEMVIHVPNHPPLAVTAQVVWSNANVPEYQVIYRGMGVRFLQITDEDREFLRSLDEPEILALYVQRKQPGPSSP
jgi:Tfp pilus assembly protein PilZ